MKLVDHFMKRFLLLYVIFFSNFVIHAKKTQEHKKVELEEKKTEIKKKSTAPSSKQTIKSKVSQSPEYFLRDPSYNRTQFHDLVRSSAQFGMALLHE